VIPAVAESSDYPHRARAACCLSAVKIAGPLIGPYFSMNAWSCDLRHFLMIQIPRVKGGLFAPTLGNTAARANRQKLQTDEPRAVRLI
jgi:hypothetical protein